MVVILALVCRFLFHGLSVAALELYVEQVARIRLSKKVFVVMLLFVGVVKEAVDFLMHQPEVLNQLTLVRDAGLLGGSLLCLWLIGSYGPSLRARRLLFFVSFIPLTIASFFYTRFIIPGTEDIWYKHVLDIVSLVFGSLAVTPRVAAYFKRKA